MNIELNPDENATIFGHLGGGKSTLVASVIAPARAKSQPVLIIDSKPTRVHPPSWEIVRNATKAKRELKAGRSVVWRTPPDPDAINEMLTWIWNAKDSYHTIFDEVTGYHRKGEKMPIEMFRIFNEGRELERTATVGARRWQQLHNEYIDNSAHLFAFKMPDAGVAYMSKFIDKDFCDELLRLKPFYYAHRHWLYDPGQYDICPPCAQVTERDINPRDNSLLAFNLTGDLI